MNNFENVCNDLDILSEINIEEISMVKISKYIIEATFPFAKINNNLFLALIDPIEQNIINYPLLNTEYGSMITCDNNLMINLTSNVEDSCNTIIGSYANCKLGVSYACAFGSGATVAQSDSVVLGRKEDRIGIRTSSPAAA